MIIRIYRTGKSVTILWEKPVETCLRSILRDFELFCYAMQAG